MEGTTTPLTIQDIEKLTKMITPKSNKAILLMPSFGGLDIYEITEDAGRKALAPTPPATSGPDQSDPRCQTCIVNRDVYLKQTIDSLARAREELADTRREIGDLHTYSKINQTNLSEAKDIIAGLRDRETQLQAELARLRAVGEAVWQKVSEILPPDDVLCLVYREDRDQYDMGYYKSKNNIWATDGLHDKDDYSHWMLAPIFTKQALGVEGGR